MRPAEAVLDPGGFWGARQQRNAAVTIPHCERWIERTGAVADFAPGSERRGERFSDSDVHKVLEAMVWAGAVDRAEALTAVIAGALEPDGYLNTYWSARGRYRDLPMGHELYCHGHLIEAAVAAARGGGPAALVDVGVAVADHVCREFGPGAREGICGHPEIELALTELYGVTGEDRHLDTARVMIDRRGHGLLGDEPFGAGYYQDDVPVRDATAMRGHAVRALYLLIGAADVAVLTGDDELLAAVERQWRATVARRTYITGGMGSRHEDEGFGDDFELPGDAYSETCAGVAAVMLAQRLLLATGDVAYADQIERTLHNVVAASTSSEGDAFFYANPLEVRAPSAAAAGESDRAATGTRVPWFWCPCCPPNVARLLARLHRYVATEDDDGVALQLYTAATVRAGAATLAVRTDYPLDGEIEVAVEASRREAWTLTLRVPPWAEGATVECVPAATGEFAPAAAGPAETGLFRLRREWRRGDVVRLTLPVAPRVTAPDPRVAATRGCVAVERGPLVYCAEALGGADLDGAAVDGAGGLVAAGDVTLIPYYAWANRGPSAMRVWLPAA